MDDPCNCLCMADFVKFIGFGTIVSALTWGVIAAVVYSVKWITENWHRLWP